MKKFHVLRSLSRSLFLFGLLGWVYIAFNAIVHPETLKMPLTHFLPYPREDTFGALAFVISFLSFWIWNYLDSCRTEDHH